MPNLIKYIRFLLTTHMNHRNFIPLFYFIFQKSPNPSFFKEKIPKNIIFAVYITLYEDIW